MAIFLLTTLTMLECKPFTGSYGYADYFNILFCNTKTYSLYGRTNWNLLNLLFFLIILIVGIYHVSEKIYTYSKGFRAMAVFRYGSCRKYLLKCQFQNFYQALLFLSIVFLNFFSSLLIIDINAFKQTSYFLIRSPVITIFLLLCYIIKFFIILNLAELWLTYLILEHKFEFLILLFIILMAVLLFVDVIFGFSFVTLTLSFVQLVYIFVYVAVYIFSLLFIMKKIKSKEIW